MISTRSGRHAIEPTNRRRIVRALEVIIGTGRRFSSFGPGLAHLSPPRARSSSGSSSTGAELDRRLAARFDDQLARGLLEEVRSLAARPEGLSRTARQAIGYRELLCHLEDGDARSDRPDVEALRRLRAFARRQESGSARPACRLVPGRPADLADTVVSLLGDVAATERRATLVTVLTARQVPGPGKRLPRRARRVTASTRPATLRPPECPGAVSGRERSCPGRADLAGELARAPVRPAHRRRSRRGARVCEQPVSGGDVRMELRNADGGRAETSGNGLRCFALAVDRGRVS